MQVSSPCPTAQTNGVSALQTVNERRFFRIKALLLLFAKGTPKRELLNVNEAIREIIVLLRHKAMQHAVLVRTELAEDLPRVKADRVQPQQVIMNLVLNSIDAMREGYRARELNIKSQRAVR
jgi:signal transduction histidine kinase